MIGISCTQSASIGTGTVDRRRALFTLLAFGLGLTRARESSAQPTRKAPVIGLLDTGRREEWWTAFRQQLRELGYVEGQNVAFETRFAGGKLEQLPALAEDLLRLKVAVIVTAGTAAARVAKTATNTTPIVFATGSDWVGAGHVASLAHPGGNMTGVTSISSGLASKRLEILREVVPKLSRLAALWHKDNPGSDASLRELEGTARSSKVALQVLGIKTPDEISGAFSAMTRERAQAVFAISGPLFFAERGTIADLAIKRRLPSIHSTPEYVQAGGLLSYGPSYVDLFRRAAIYVDKILKGANPADLPIEQPTRLELDINLKTARAIGLTIPRLLLLRADRVIE